jgi:hypothetical protein
MNNEENLKQLLMVAQTNGWKPYGYFIDLFQITNDKCLFEIAVIEDNTVYFRPVWNMSFDEMSISLNDLVTNFEPNEVSFIDALIKTPFHIVSDEYKLKGAKDIYVPKDRFISYWHSTPTSVRINVLFDTFNHLL